MSEDQYEEDEFEIERREEEALTNDTKFLNESAEQFIKKLEDVVTQEHDNLTEESLREISTQIELLNEIVAEKDIEQKRHLVRYYNAKYLPQTSPNAKIIFSAPPILQ